MDVGTRGQNPLSPTNQSAGRSRKHEALGGELEDGFHLFPSESESLGNFPDRMALFEAYKDVSERYVSAAEDPNAAGFSGYAFRRRTF